MAGVGDATGGAPERLYVGHTREAVIQHAIDDGHTFLTRYPEKIDAYIQHDPETGQYYIPKTNDFQRQFKGFGSAYNAFQTYDVYGMPEKAGATASHVGDSLSTDITDATNNFNQSMKQVEGLRSDFESFAGKTDVYLGILGLVAGAISIPFGLVGAVAGNSPISDLVYWLTTESKTGFRGFRLMSRFQQSRMIQGLVQWLGNLEKFIIETRAQIKVKEDKDFQERMGISDNMVDCMWEGGELTRVQVPQLYKALGVGIGVLATLVPMVGIACELYRLSDEGDSESPAAGAENPTEEGVPLDLSSLLSGEVGDTEPAETDPTLLYFDTLSDQYTAQSLAELQSQLTGDQALNLKSVFDALQRHDYTTAKKEYDAYVKTHCGQEDIDDPAMCLDPKIQECMDDIFDTWAVTRLLKKYHGIILAAGGISLTVGMYSAGSIIQGDAAVNAGEGVYKRNRSPQASRRERALDAEVDRRASAIAVIAKAKYATQTQCQEAPATAPVPTPVRAPIPVGVPAPSDGEEDTAPTGAPVAAQHAMVSPDFAMDMSVHDYVYGYMPVEDLGELARGAQVAADGRIRVAIDYTNRIIRVMDQGAWELAMEHSSARVAEPTAEPFSWENFKGTGNGRGSGTIRTGTGPGGSGVGSAASFAGGVFVYSAVGVLLGVAVEKSGLSEVQKMGVMYTYTGMGVVMTAQAVKANPQLLHLVAPGWFGAEAGGLLTGMILDAAGVEDPTIRQVAGGVGSVTGAAGMTYAGLRMLARGGSKTPVTLVFAAGAMAISSVADQRELDKIKASFLGANPHVADEFESVCKVLEAVCQGSLGFGTKPLEQFTDEDLKMFRWLLGEDSFGDGKLSTPLTQEIIKAMGGWFVRQYFPSLESSMAAEHYMTYEEIRARDDKAAAFSEIKLAFENPGYSTERYDYLCGQLDTLLADWDPANLKKVHTLLYDPSYKAVLAIHGADIALNYLEPFMEVQFAFRNTALDLMEESAQDWVRDASEVAAQQEHRDKYGNWMLALYRHVQDPNYKTIVPLPTGTDRHVTTQSVAPRDDISYVSLRAPEGRGNPSGMTTVTPLRAPTGMELQQAQSAYAALKKKPPIPESTGYFDTTYTMNYYERQLTGDQKSWYDETLPILMGTKMRELHDAGQMMVAGELMKLWIQDVKDNLGAEWGISDADVGKALQMLTALEHDVEEYERSENKAYLYRASSHPGVTIGPDDFMGNFLTDEMRDITRFIDEA